jgi:hypothetical protein
LKQRNLTKRKARTPREASHDAFSRRLPPTPAPSRTGALRATSPKALPGSTYYSKAEYTNTQQDLPVGGNYFTNSRHEKLLASGFLLLKSNKEYVLTVKILAQVLVGLIFTKLTIWYKQGCTIQLIKHNIHQLPSLGISWLVE